MLAIVYFGPTIVAITRTKRNTAAIFVTNLFLGWTAIGWVVALVWSLMYEEPKHRRPPTVVSAGARQGSGSVRTGISCGICGNERITLKDRFCESCGTPTDSSDFSNEGSNYKGPPVSIQKKSGKMGYMCTNCKAKDIERDDRFCKSCGISFYYQD